MKNAIRQHLATLSEKAAAFKRFCNDRTGMGAVEFAIITPLLIVAYIGSFEVSVGYSVARKVTRASSTVADVLTQQTDVAKTALDGMPYIVSSVMTPFNPDTGFTLKVTGIKITAPGVGVVAWSRGWSGPWSKETPATPPTGTTPYMAGSTVTVPTDVSVLNAFIVRSELEVAHDLLLFASSLSNHTIKPITISKTSYYRQRIGDEITCGDCGP